MNHQFELGVSYHQIAVFRPEIEGPFNEWTKSHSAQGFTWRDGSVSFATLEDGGPHAITVSTESSRRRAIRAIEVPFEVTGKTIVVAAIGGEKNIAVPSGRYSLLFRTGRAKGNRFWCEFVFTPNETATPAIVIADAALSPSKKLLMKAQAAV